MSTTHSDRLEQLIRCAGEDWLIDWFAPPSDALPFLRNRLQAANERLQCLLPGAEFALDESTLEAEYQQSPHKARAFLQALGETQSADMLVMAWRLLHGAEIADVTMNYQMQMQQPFHLTIHLHSPDGGPDEPYASDDIRDARVLRHFGITEVDGVRIFDGFYPLQRGK